MIRRRHGQSTRSSRTRSGYLQSLNHNPLDLGDNLPTPVNPPIIGGNVAGTAILQTWWGFPTWRETLSVNWNDPDAAGQ